MYVGCSYRPAESVLRELGGGHRVGRPGNFRRVPVRRAQRSELILMEAELAGPNVTPALKPLQRQDPRLSQYSR
jgi:hypothetical protein